MTSQQQDAPSRDTLDRLAEAVRRYRHGLMRPLWIDMTEQDKEGWRNVAGTFITMLRSVGLRLEIGP